MEELAHALERSANYASLPSLSARHAVGRCMAGMPALLVCKLSMIPAIAEMSEVAMIQAKLCL